MTPNLAMHRTALQRRCRRKPTGDLERWTSVTLDVCDVHRCKAGGSERMRRLLLSFMLASLFACATTEYKLYEGKENVYEGKGGTKVVVDGMELWDNGAPPRKFKVLGIIDDERPGGIIPMSQLRRDMVKKAREVGGDALVELTSQSQIAGFYTTGTGSAYSYGSSTSAYGTATTMPVRRNTAKFAVIKYIDL